MKHRPAEFIEWTPAPAEHFTGEVWFGPLSHEWEDGLNALAVHFSPGPAPRRWRPSSADRGPGGDRAVLGRRPCLKNVQNRSRQR